jgi:hypothetical protein
MRKEWTEAQGKKEKEERGGWYERSTRRQGEGGRRAKLDGEVTGSVGRYTG